VTIRLRPDGPYQVLGDVELLDADGNPIPLPEDGKVFLCRCGHSSDKPFCDGTHKRSGWCETQMNEQRL
jgi:CDGSH-type Zn-finger protein